MLTTAEVFVKLQLSDTPTQSSVVKYTPYQHKKTARSRTRRGTEEGSVPAYATRQPGARDKHLPAEFETSPSQFGAMRLAMSPDNLLFFCSVTASVAAAFALVSLYRSLTQRRPQRPSADGPGAGGGSESEELLPLSAAAAGLPPFMYNRLVRHSGKGASWTECAVCLGVIQVGAMVKLLPACSHVYHRDCIDLWLSSRSTCPLCRCRVGPSPSETGQGPPQQLAQPPPA